MYTRGSKTASTFNRYDSHLLAQYYVMISKRFYQSARFVNKYILDFALLNQLHMFRFSDISLLGNSADTELYLGCESLGYESPERCVMVKELKDERSKTS